MDEDVHGPVPRSAFEVMDFTDLLLVRCRKRFLVKLLIAGGILLLEG